MKTSFLICATCLIVTGCTAQLRLPSLSSALSSLTGIGASSSSNQASSAQSQSPYSGLVRDYGRNLMMAMSSIYPTLFKPPQQQQQQSQPAPQSPFDSAFNGQFGNSQNLFSQQPSPSFSFGGSTFSISPSLPFGSLNGNGPSVQQGQQGQPMASASSPFGASFGSSINSPPSFGSLSNSNMFAQQPQFAPASSYQAALEAASGGASLHGGQQSFDSIRSSPQLQSSASSLVAQQTNSHPSSYSPMASFGGQHDPSASMNIAQHNQAPQHHQHSIGQSSNLGPHSPSFSNQQHSQFAPQHYRPDMMSIAASAPIPSSNSYSNYANMPQGASSQQQVPASSNSFQQPSYR